VSGRRTLTSGPPSPLRLPRSRPRAVRIRLGLGRTRELLAALGSPEREIRGVLWCTNGKGSVVALVAPALPRRDTARRDSQAAPGHYRERIRIAGHPISAAAFASLVAAGLPVADRVARRHGPPTEFELLTALAFRHFADEGVDLAIVEVGLGGRLDATHAWTGGGRDHECRSRPHRAPRADRRGDCREKAAIIMPGDIAITGAGGPALGPIRRRARRARVSLLEVPPAPVLAADRHGLLVELPGLGATRVGLLGRHQRRTWRSRMRCSTRSRLPASRTPAGRPARRVHGGALARPPGAPRPARSRAARGRRRGPPRRRPQPGGRPRACRRARRAAAGAAGRSRSGRCDDPGAFEPVECGDPRRTSIGPAASDARGGRDGRQGRRRPDRRLVTSRALAGARVIVTAVPGARAMAPEALAARWRAAVPEMEILVVRDPASAVDRAVASAEGPVVVAGSLYLVGAARARLVDDPELRDPDDAVPA